MKAKYLLWMLLRQSQQWEEPLLPVAPPKEESQMKDNILLLLLVMGTFMCTALVFVILFVTGLIGGQ
jgi:hypothetical protein